MANNESDGIYKKLRSKVPHLNFTPQVLVLIPKKATAYNEKTPQFHGEFSSLTITIFPSFIKKTNEIIQRE
jgi:hypothetical protein